LGLRVLLGSRPENLEVRPTVLTTVGHRGLRGLLRKIWARARTAYRSQYRRPNYPFSRPLSYECRVWTWTPQHHYGMDGDGRVRSFGSRAGLATYFVARNTRRTRNLLSLESLAGLVTCYRLSYAQPVRCELVAGPACWAVAGSQREQGKRE